MIWIEKFYCDSGQARVFKSDVLVIFGKYKPNLSGMSKSGDSQSTYCLGMLATYDMLSSYTTS